MFRVRISPGIKRRTIALISLIISSIISHQHSVFYVLFYEPVVYENLSYKIALFSSLTFIGIFLYNFMYKKFVDSEHEFSKDWMHNPKIKSQIQIASAALVIATISWNVCLSAFWGGWTPLFTLNISIGLLSFFSLF